MIFVIMIIGGCLTDMASVFVLTDFGNGIVIFLNVPSLILLSGELRRLTREWFGNNGDLKAIEAQRAAKEK